MHLPTTYSWSTDNPPASMSQLDAGGRGERLAYRRAPPENVPAPHLENQWSRVGLGQARGLMMPKSAGYSAALSHLARPDGWHSMDTEGERVNCQVRLTRLLCLSVPKVPGGRQDPGKLTRRTCVNRTHDEPQDEGGLRAGRVHAARKGYLLV